MNPNYAQNGAAVGSSAWLGGPIYAYGVKPLYGGPNGSHFQWLESGEILLWEPHVFHHYWVDDKLQYHECLKDDDKFPEIEWATGGLKVELHGPNNFTVKSA